LDYVDPARAAAEQEIDALRRGKGATFSGSDSDNTPNERKFGPVSANAASRAVMQRWVQEAKQAIQDRESDRTIALCREIEGVLNQMNPKDDWFFTRDLRMNGQSLKAEGDAVLLQHNRLCQARDLAIQ